MLKLTRCCEVADKSGKSLETLTQKIFDLISKDDRYTTVEHNVLLDSPDGKRQIDVLIRSKVSGLDLMTIVECRDYNKTISVEHVDGLASKRDDVLANKAVLVAKKGFSKTAKRKAKRLGITLCTAHDAERGLEGIGLLIPVVVTEVLPNAECNATAVIESSTETYITADAIFKIADKYVFDYLGDAITTGHIHLDAPRVEGSFSPDFGAEDPYIRDIDGNVVRVTNVVLEYALEIRFYVGDVTELPHSLALNNLCVANC